MIKLEINIGTEETPDWQEAWLGDTSINMQHVNPIFDTDAGGAFSESFDLDCEMNRHIVGNIDQINGDSVFARLYRKRFRLSADGVPVLYGIVWLDKEMTIDKGAISLTLQSDNKEWNEILEGKKLQDLDFIEDEKNRVLIGCCFPDYPLVRYHYSDGYILKNYQGIEKRRVSLGHGYADYQTYIGDELISCDVKGSGTMAGITFPRLMFPKIPGREDNLVNVQTPYNPITRTPAYCNIRTCLTRYKPEGDDGKTWTAQRDYNVHEPHEMNTAPCFFVAYIIDRVFDAIKVYVDTKVFSQIPDFYRLALIHSNCAYTAKDYNDEYINVINRYPDETYPYNRDKGTVSQYYFSNDSIRLFFRRSVNTDSNLDSIFYGTPDAKTDVYGSDWVTYLQTSKKKYAPVIVTREENGKEINDLHFREYISAELDQGSLSLCEAYATSANLPDIEFKAFLDGIMNGFGLRLLYDAQEGTAKFILLRDLLTQEETEVLPCEVNEVYKTEEDIRGFRMKYSSSGEYKTNAITGLLYYTAGDDDTVYNYYDDRRAIVFGSDYATQQPTTSFSREPIPRSYKDMLQSKSDTNMNYYVDGLTGNGYRFKVDKEAKKMQEWYPSLFQVGGFRDVIIGGVSDEDRTETISIEWTPFVENDVNGKYEYLEKFPFQTDEDSNVVGPTIKEAVWPKLALFIEGETHVSYSDKGEPDGDFIRQEYTYDDQGVDYYYDAQHNVRSSGFLNLAVIIESRLNWDYTQGEPFTDGEANFMLGIMRGSGGEAHREVYNMDYDGEDNAYWMDIPGSDAEVSSDSCNACGQWYDYNGEAAGLGWDYSVKIFFDTMQITSKEHAEAVIKQYFQYSNPDLFDSRRKVSGTAMRAKGWDVGDADYCTYYTVSFGLQDGDKRVKEFLVTPILDDGTILTPSELEELLKYYEEFAVKGNNPIMAWDNSIMGRKVVIKEYDTREEATAWADFLHVLGDYYYGDTHSGPARYPSLIQKKQNKPLSLKIKAEKPYQGGLKKKDESGKEYLVTDWLSDTREDGQPAYHPIESMYAKRGLFDVFYTEYAYFVLHRKIAHFEIHTELAALLNIDFTKKYTIGDISGWIKKYSYSINQNTGVSDISIELYYL